VDSIERRLTELQSGGRNSDADQIERAGLYALHRLGFETIEQTTGCFANENPYEVWYYETLVWTARRMRAHEIKRVLRGFAQLRTYAAKAEERHFCLGATKDHLVTVSDYLERALDGEIIREVPHAQCDGKGCDDCLHTGTVESL